MISLPVSSTFLHSGRSTSLSMSLGASHRGFPSMTASSSSSLSSFRCFTSQLFRRRGVVVSSATTRSLFFSSCANAHDVLQPFHLHYPRIHAVEKSTNQSILLRQYHTSHYIGQTDTTSSSETVATQSTTSPKEPPPELPAATTIYETPFPGIIVRLRAVSWFTGLGGLIAFPLTYAAQSGDPSTLAFWVISGTFGMATMSTTAAVTYLFRPYVFAIERVAVPIEEENEEASSSEKDLTTATNDSPTNDHASPPNKFKFLYKAHTRSIFLFAEEHLFDPTTELKAYSGLTKPLCNLLVVKDDDQDVPLYVHPENLTDPTILKTLGKDVPALRSSKGPTPEEELLKKKD